MKENFAGAEVGPGVAAVRGIEKVSRKWGAKLAGGGDKHGR